jgi:hypothetical protein
VFIKQNDDDSKKLIFETLFKKIDELMIDLIDFQIDLRNNLIFEENQMITFEMTSNRELMINDQVHVVILFMSKIIEIHIASKAAQHSSIDSISDVQIRFKSMNSQTRFESLIQNVRKRNRQMTS